MKVGSYVSGENEPKKYALRDSISRGNIDINASRGNISKATVHNMATGVVSRSTLRIKEEVSFAKQ